MSDVKYPELLAAINAAVPWRLHAIYAAVEAVYEAKCYELAALRERYARGELDDDELQAICHNLPAECKEAFHDGCDATQRKLTGSCRTDELRAELTALRAQHAAFKQAAHAALDEAGVPQFGDEKCRVGARIRWLAEQHAKLVEACYVFRAALPAEQGS